LRDHYLEAEKYGHAAKMRVTIIFPLINQINSEKIVVMQLKKYCHTHHILG